MQAATPLASLAALTAKAGQLSARFIADRAQRLLLEKRCGAATLSAPVEALRGRTILLRVERQLSAVSALLALDGIAARIILCPPDLAAAHLPAIIANTSADFMVSDAGIALPQDGLGIPVISCELPAEPGDPAAPDRESEWLLFTSGTTGTPKMVVHTLHSLTGAMPTGQAVSSPSIWSSFYDIRRYGGLQILLRALTGGGSMVLSDASEPVGEFLGRIGDAGVTHISGTPSHWRRALMSPSIGKISPAYLRLSGEIADQIILNTLKSAFPAASISHAYASTEAGVAFDVRDGLAGFPAAWVGQPEGGVEMQLKNGSLHIRSARCSTTYAGAEARRLTDDEGFVDTGDMVVLQDDRYYFAGRREGVINVGGLKIHPEEVEAVINAHPAVRMSRVKAKSSPITGAIVVADIVLEKSAAGTKADLRATWNEILQSCRERLPAHKVPALLKEVPALEITAAGKLLRNNA
jgi:acyl-coenzyme A synthetase/AMP-(fatty) acid ligase